MKHLLVYAMAISIAIIGCGGETVRSESRPLGSIEDIPVSTWQALSRKKLYFGHQSLGNNIMIGIAETMASHPEIKMNIVKLGDIPSVGGQFFAHEEVGKNDWPLTKTKAFGDRIRSGLGEKVDIAFLKYCFWDIRSHTDVQEVFKDYKETVAALRAQYPKVTFVHFTVPLMAYQTGVTAGVKRMLHFQVEWDIDNIKRDELNALILQEYGGKEPVFDIAAIESTLPDGSHVSFSHNGMNYSYLAQEYTNDGGHLNPEGRKRVAEQLLITLAHIAESF
jgi:lysophospholipase L1-like esterase